MNPKDDWAIIEYGGSQNFRVVRYAGGRSRKKMETIARKMNNEPKSWSRTHLRYSVRFCVHKNRRAITP